MGNTLKIKFSDTPTSAPSSLADGEIAINRADKKLFYTDDTDTVQSMPLTVQALLDAKQPSDSDLTAIAAISPSNDDFIQRKSGVWVNRTMAQLKTDLAVDLINNTSDATKNSASVTLTNKTLTSPVINGATGLQFTADFQIFCHHAGLSYTDSSNNYFGALSVAAAATGTSALRQIALPANVTCIGYSITTLAGGSPTSETASIYLRINNTTDNLLSSALTWTNNVCNVFTGMALSIDIDAGVKWELKLVTPAWVTNPTAAVMTAILFFKWR